MDELLYLFLGWLLGLLGPQIVDAIKAKRHRRELALAIRSEAEDLQYRVAITSFLLMQRFGEVSRDYLLWLKPKVASYRGNEAVEATGKLVESLLTSSDEHLLAFTNHLRAKEGMGLSLKKFGASLIESSLADIHSFPVEYQRRIHEFRNQLSALNQEIERALESHRMTFDGSISHENHIRLKEDLLEKYIFIRGMCDRVADRLGAIIEYDASKI